MEKRLSQLLEKPVAGVEKIFGDASYRTYYRIQLENGETRVLMEIPEGKMSVSEEITNLKNPPGEFPFVNIHRYLKSLELPVPEIILFSEKDRWLILQDLWDTQFLDLVENVEDHILVGWYKKAIDLLVEIQTKTSKGGDTNCIAFQRSFDATLFNWEFDHFLEYYFQNSVVSSQLSEKDKNVFKEETLKITEALCKLPQVFTHRDFQSKNLMYYEDRLYLLDFQDAILGPKTYDLVALLRDSYVDISAHLETLIKYYCEKSGENLQNFRRAFDLQTVQRKLKDAGRFVFIDRVKKNPNFLRYIPTTLSYIQQALESLPKFKELYKILKKHFKEWS